MDRDPELEVTLSNGRCVAPFQIAARDRTRETWTLIEPGLPPRVIAGDAAALAARQRLDARIAARLAAGWVPVDRPTPAEPVPLPADLTLQIRSLLEALVRARRALLAVDPSGQLWAATQVWRQQAGRVGLVVRNPGRTRAWEQRRLGELAEQRGDLAAAECYYGAALASSRRAGVRRRLAQLRQRRGVVDPRSGESPARLRSQCPRARHPARGAHAERSARTRRSSVQIVGRIPARLHRRVRAAATHQQRSLNAFLIDALRRAVTDR